ncbi:aldo/keto reductase [Buchananella hordeovulneris]|uniref:aldo/keto reductase n=1 Tax=Buchananella hordeovulneris TaxID=52770 RepID=UPI0026DC5081|nr:aldo/keto reductase [Buchananella hordeovulneris]MDO5079700.1 aldo/keto reductase [Buchananella hordeovulneris]
MQRIIGGIETFPIGLGCMGMTMSYGPVDKAEAAATVRAAVDAGVTMFDTAQMYGGGRNEALIGPLLAPVRDNVVIATKTGIRTRFGGLPVGLDGRPTAIRQGLDASLQRLHTDRVDLYYLHRVDPKVPLEDSIGALADGVRAGKVRAIGVSEVTGSQLRRAHAVHPIAAVQMEWSLFSRTLEDDVLPVARELGVGVVAYAPLGRGMLTGSPAATTGLPLLDYRRALPRWRKKNLAANLQAVETVRQVAIRHDATPGQVALAWVLARGEDVVPIPGTKRRRYLQENLAALKLRLSPVDLAELDQIRAQGERYGRLGVSADE